MIKNNASKKEGLPLKWSPQDWCILIPARLGSTRLPNKPILPFKGKPLVVQTAGVGLQLKKQHADISVAVATDSQNIQEICAKNGIDTINTDGNFPSGSDRVFYAAKKLNKKFILNLQCDEPEIPLEDLIALMSQLESNEDFDMNTIAAKNSSKSSYLDPNVVKCLRGDQNLASDFSRVGFHTQNELDKQDFYFFHHKGVYAYRYLSLQKFCELPPSIREGQERLEQLRAIESGMKVGLVISRKVSKGIDTKEDLI